MSVSEIISFGRIFSKTLRKNVSSLIGFAIVVFFVLMAIFGPIILPFDYSYFPSRRYEAPSWEHPLGLDFGGRDLLREIIAGSRDVLLVAFITGTVTTLIALTVGIASGMIGGLFDTSVMTITDIFLTIPSFPLLVIISAGMPRVMNAFEVGVLFSIVSWAGLARIVRSQVLSTREKPFIEAARSLNLSNFHILFYEILPNLMSYVVMNLVQAIVNGIYTQVGMFTLGLLPYTTVNWGLMINYALGENALINSKAWLYLFSPIVCIVLIQTGFILTLHSLGEVFNPRLRSEE